MKVYVKLKNPKSEKPTTIYLSYYSSIDKRYFKRSLFQKVTPKNWNSKEGKFLSENGVSFKLNAVITSKKLLLEKVIMELMFEGIDLNIINIRNAYDKKEAENLSLNDTLDLFLKSKPLLADKSIEAYTRMIKYILTFDKKFKIDAYNVKIKDSLVKYFQQIKKLNNTSTVLQFKLLNTLIKWSKENNYSTTDPIKVYIKYDSKTKISLSIEEIDKIYKLDDSLLTVNQRKSRDLFVFLCSTSLRISDLKQIRRSNVRDDVIHINQTKTKQDVMIPLNIYSKSIMEKYEYTLPKIDKTVLNVQIKIICLMAGIDEMIEVVEFFQQKRVVYQKPKYSLVSSHTGRRSYISHLIKKGISHTIIMRISGHRTYESFKKYVKLESTDLQNAVKGVF